MTRHTGSTRHIDTQQIGCLTEAQGCARRDCFRAPAPPLPHSTATPTIPPRRAPAVPPPSSAAFLLAHDP